jgi:hypothetical protein
MPRNASVSDPLVIYVCNPDLRDFVDSVLPRLSARFVLLTGNDDETAPFEILSKTQVSGEKPNPSGLCRSKAKILFALIR